MPKSSKKSSKKLKKNEHASTTTAKVIHSWSETDSTVYVYPRLKFTESDPQESEVPSKRTEYADLR